MCPSQRLWGEYGGWGTGDGFTFLGEILFGELIVFWILGSIKLKHRASQDTLPFPSELLVGHVLGLVERVI